MQNQRIKQSQKITKIINLETREKIEFNDIYFVIYYELFKNQWSENPPN